MNCPGYVHAVFAHLAQTTICNDEGELGADISKRDLPPESERDLKKKYFNNGNWEMSNWKYLQI